MNMKRSGYENRSVYSGCSSGKDYNIKTFICRLTLHTLKFGSEAGTRFLRKLPVLRTAVSLFRQACRKGN